MRDERGNTKKRVARNTLPYTKETERGYVREVRDSTKRSQKNEKEREREGIRQKGIPMKTRTSHKTKTTIREENRQKC